MVPALPSDRALSSPATCLANSIPPRRSGRGRPCACPELLHKPEHNFAPYGPVGAGLVPALNSSTSRSIIPPPDGPVGAGLVPALNSSTSRSIIPPRRSCRGRPCACPELLHKPEHNFAPYGPVGAGLVPALCPSKSRNTISPTVTARFTPDPFVQNWDAPDQKFTLDFRLHSL